MRWSEATALAASLVVTMIMISSASGISVNAWLDAAADRLAPATHAADHEPADEPANGTDDPRQVRAD